MYDDFHFFFLGGNYGRERSQMETATTIGDHMNSTNSPTKRTASFVCLTLKDLPNLTTDQSLGTVSGTLNSHSTIFKTLPHRKTHRSPNRQQPIKIKSTNGLEIDKTSSISPPILTVPNLLDLATRSTPLPMLTSTMNYIDPSSIDSPNRYAYESHVDSNGINHHRLHLTTDNLLRSNSKIETLALRTTSPGISVKMPVVVHHGNSKRTSPQRNHLYMSQPALTTIDSVLRERSVVIANENTHQPDAMERVNHILKQLYLPTDKSKRS